MPAWGIANCEIYDAVRLFGEQSPERACMRHVLLVGSSELILAVLPADAANAAVDYSKDAAGGFTAFDGDVAARLVQELCQAEAAFDSYVIHRMQPSRQPWQRLERSWRACNRRERERRPW